MTPESLFADRIAVAESLLGYPLHDEYGFAECPGAHLHEKNGGHRHFKVHGLRSSNVFGHCFHTHCQEVVREFNRKLETELIVQGLNVWPFGGGDQEPERYKRHKKMCRDDAQIAKLAKGVLPEIGDMLPWLEDRSPAACDGIHGFLSALYPGQKVLLFTDEQSQGQLVWDEGLDPAWQAQFSVGNLNGAWFQIQPVTGEWLYLDRLKTKWNPLGKTRRATENLVECKYLLLESDSEDLETWCRVLVQLPLPIVSITTSGSRSLHALVYAGFGTRSEWEKFRYDIEKIVVALGCDTGALKVAQLSRLPGCLRYGKTNKENRFEPFLDGPRLQRLLWLNPEARGESSILELTSRI